MFIIINAYNSLRKEEEKKSFNFKHFPIRNMLQANEKSTFKLCFPNKAYIQLQFLRLCVTHTATRAHTTN